MFSVTLKSVTYRFFEFRKTQCCQSLFQRSHYKSLASPSRVSMHLQQKLIPGPTMASVTSVVYRISIMRVSSLSCTNYANRFQLFTHTYIHNIWPVFPKRFKASFNNIISSLHMHLNYLLHVGKHGYKIRCKCKVKVCILISIAYITSNIIQEQTYFYNYVT